MAGKKRVRRTGEQIVDKLRDGETMLAAGKDLAHVLQAFGIAESTWQRWRKHYGGMQPDEAKRLAARERENAQFKRVVADLALAWGSWCNCIESGTVLIAQDAVNCPAESACLPE